MVAAAQQTPTEFVARLQIDRVLKVDDGFAQIVLQEKIVSGKPYESEEVARSQTI